MVDKIEKSGIASDRLSAGRVHRTAEDLQRTIENLSVDGIMDGVAGEAVGSGYRGNATHAAHRQAGSASKREEERRKFTRAMVRAMKELDRLNAEIDGLNGKIDGILAKHLTEDEQKYLNSIKDEREKHREQMRLMREKLERGEISEAEFDQFNRFWEKLRDKLDARDEAKQKLRDAEPEAYEQIVREIDIQDAEAAAHEVGGKKAVQFEIVAESVDDAGSVETTNDKDMFGGFAADGAETSLPGQNSMANVLTGNPLTSVASAAMPDNPLLAKAPALKPEFTAKAGQVEPVQPEAKSEIEIDSQRDPTSSPTGFG